jgi:hypothetical protein
MTRIIRSIIVLVTLPVLLGGCFLIPGAFTSSLDLRRDGQFTFAYKGEVLFQSPDEAMKMGSGTSRVWNDSMAVCPRNGEPYSNDWDVTVAPSSPADEEAQEEESPNRACTREEIARLKKEWDVKQAERRAKDRKEGEQFAAMFGFNPADEASNRKLASTMMRQDGWKSVIYRGEGVFDVDYQISGRIGHDFIFPVFPQGEIIIPFVMVRGQDKGSVRVSAPALAGSGLKSMGSQAKWLGAGVAQKDAPLSRTKGRFTITTDGEILTNNTEDGPGQATNGRVLVWDIDSQMNRTPEALIRLR